METNPARVPVSLIGSIGKIHSPESGRTGTHPRIPNPGAKGAWGKEWDLPASQGDGKRWDNCSPLHSQATFQAGASVGILPFSPCSSGTPFRLFFVCCNPSSDLELPKHCVLGKAACLCYSCLHANMGLMVEDTRAVGALLSKQEA